ncbi:MAG: Stp1/IreP family PP2C-type Ser/Thr phosphatase [Terrisporobacter othiniensis]|uniref:Stp1/IreP family PP2C-type Ser/Thr phosphatase n=2 Tax=Terrisporobacter TaxID=1505652 RepID=A0AAX2ZBU1_9FIRM|nr:MULTISPECIES: Stp1/IreP family PP2C-type Ser/Thr phosphatase [Terrisporobacter]MBN9646538.1 Stp1/IreP family PP2C-type Ser/Thr phosphatase [Terrisporobacter glycolicus]MDU4859525.1 Stp1/IreP family PP2C-type Ser/Thr phosphatase [Terrisporobacter othiniensis]MCC3865831.1 Stp1/IreP family PP2C-type Ser/Thr phosphatase [Terrisporobacter petrolearius]MDU6993912.1 Stp1/IreP family PP2C-type Ser/Thr phosphatase [Terrisporobacter othiniensis]UEL46808.1 Stp1/IreP family PP2C-type Ser/Thr phosphatas
MIYNCDSHMGKVRKNNEDYCMGEILQTEDDCIGVFALADGMGGHNKGEVASKIAVESIIDFLKENISQSGGIKMDYLDDIIKQGYNYANKKIYTKALEDNSCKGMGTTLVVAVIYQNDVIIANVGDSRGYLLKGDSFRKITKDHSVVEELVNAHLITEEEARFHPRRNQITRAMGAEEIIIVDIFREKVEKDDILLLATDGLTGCVEDESIKNIIKQDKDIKEICQDLINEANNNSGKDNISVILSKID